MTPTLSPQQREEVLEAMARNLHHARNKARWPHLEVEDWKTVSHLEKRYYRDLAAAALDVALLAIIGAVEKDVLQRECSAYTAGLLDGWGCGETRNQEAFDFHWHHSPYRLVAKSGEAKP